MLIGKWSSYRFLQVFFKWIVIQQIYSDSWLTHVQDSLLIIADIHYIRSIFPDHADEAFFDFLAKLDLSGLTVWAIKEGTAVFPNVPLLIIQGPLAVCQLLETPLLNFINYASLVTTNAARIRLAVGESKELAEFGLRRAQGPNGGISASLYSFLGGL
ncbi:unnamed protein product [Dibothriocephalus latus]|uniref:nicotinate phosphoribosyltransferase n=1 Tax=Dibothriocephalus latus TaxID=60516 RepID=A0A3P7P8W8_DIBLA|nr:unnamed protein product [Dibothriocephalus latus]